jgi:hypothetical protein
LRALPQQLPPPRWGTPADTERLSYGLGGMLELIGCESATAPDGIELALLWRASERIDANHSMFVYALRGGGIVAQSDGTPAGGSLPTSCWLPGEVVADSHLLGLDMDAALPVEIGVAASSPRSCRAGRSEHRRRSVRCGVTEARR